MILIIFIRTQQLTGVYLIRIVSSPLQIYVTNTFIRLIGVIIVVRSLTTVILVSWNDHVFQFNVVCVTKLLLFSITIIINIKTIQLDWIGVIMFGKTLEMLYWIAVRKHFAHLYLKLVSVVPLYKFPTHYLSTVNVLLFHNIHK